MLKQLLFISLLTAFSVQLFAQNNSDSTKVKYWTYGGGLGFDLAQLLMINPKVGAGENRLGFGGNISFFVKYNKGRAAWNNNLVLNFGVQKLGRGYTRPFQKSIDELRFTSAFAYALTENNPFSYAVDLAFLTQLTPTYEGNYLSYKDGFSTIKHPISQFVSPATLQVTPGIAYKPSKGKLVGLSLLVSPASFKMIAVGSDSIAMLGNTARTNSFHGNPYGWYTSEDEFAKEWLVRPAGWTADSSAYYAKTFLQFGASIKATYARKFLKDKKGKERIAFATSLTLYSNYLRQPQNIDVEWITNTDFYIIKGLSISLGTNLFYDYDVLVQIDKDKNINTGVNGYEETGRRVSFTETLLIKYNFLF